MRLASPSRGEICALLEYLSLQLDDVRMGDSSFDPMQFLRHGCGRLVAAQAGGP